MTTLLTGGGTRSREVLDDDVDLARDRALVTRAQAGDRTAFDDLYARYYRRLYRFCLRRLHDSYEAEDVAQEAFSRAWRALPNFAGDRRFYPWLSVIAAHLCTDVLRRRNRSTPVAEFHQGNVASTEDGGEELMLARVDSDLVARAFNRLSDRHQRILHLREGSGWSYQKIADHEGVGITAVETLLWRARQALKREFAALAGAEGRIAAWVGTAGALATLRRFLRLPSHAARRLAHVGQGGSAVAMGSAAAATAMVVAATLSGPMAQSQMAVPGTGSPGGFGGISTGTLNPSSPSSSGGGSSGDSASGGNGPSAGDDASVPGAPAGAHALSGVSSSVNGAVGSLGTAGSVIGGTVDSTLNGVTSTVSSAAQEVAAGLGATVQNLGGAVSGLLTPLGQLPLGPVGTVVGGLGQSISGAVVTAGSLVSGVAGLANTAVGSIVGSASATGSSSSGSSSSGASKQGSDPGSSSSGSTSCSSGIVGSVVGAVTSTLSGTKPCS